VFYLIALLIKQGGPAHYAYDSDNRLIRAETPNGTSQYRYDALSRCITKLTPEGETRFVYDGARLLQETRTERQRTYLFEPDSFRPLACID
jgi:YD repeat-containing protein